MTKTTNETVLQESTRKEEFKMEKKCSINKTIRPFYDEPTYKDFLSREQFIAATGVFLTPRFYEYVHQDFLDSGKTLEEFVSTYEDIYKKEIFPDGSDIIKIHLGDFDEASFLLDDGKEANVVDYLFMDTNLIYHLEDKIERLEKIIDIYDKALLEKEPSNGIYS